MSHSSWTLIHAIHSPSKFITHTAFWWQYILLKKISDEVLCMNLEHIHTSWACVISLAINLIELHNPRLGWFQYSKTRIVSWYFSNSIKCWVLFIFRGCRSTRFYILLNTLFWLAFTFLKTHWIVFSYILDSSAKALSLLSKKGSSEGSRF
jgi:hypothetical protein